MHQLHEQNKSKPNRLKILFWSTGAWERGGLEFMWATSLYSRGHRIMGITCDGGFSACSMESIYYPRPSCEYCHERNLSMIDIFGLREFFQPISKYLTQIDRNAIRDEIEAIPFEKIMDFEWQGIPLGKHMSRDLPQYYFRYVNAMDRSLEPKIRDSLYSSYLYTIVAENVWKNITPDRGVVTGGKTIAYGSFYNVCMKNTCPVITWDESMMGSFVFGKNGYANEYVIDEAWERYKDIELSDQENMHVESFFSKSSQGIIGNACYYKSPVLEEKRIREELGFDPNKPLVSLMTNILWDTSALGRDIAFDSMLDWIIKTIDFYHDSNEVQLVIRCHPHGADQDFKTFRDTYEYIMEHYDGLPDHIKIIPSHSQISSHSLCGMSSLICVYGTTMGLEMAVRGLNVLVCGDVHFRGRGFTCDIDTLEQYLSILGNLKGFKSTLSQEQVAYARRYSHLWLMKFHTYFSEFCEEERHTFDLIPEDLFSGDNRWAKLSQETERLGDFSGISMDPHR
jgi:hypothetical protein